MFEQEVSRYDIYIADLPMGKSHVEMKKRPVIVVSNEAANQHSPVLTVVPLTSAAKKGLPTHVKVTAYGLHKPSTALCEQILSIDREALMARIGAVEDKGCQVALNRALQVQLGI